MKRREHCYGLLSLPQMLLVHSDKNAIRWLITRSWEANLFIFQPNWGNWSVPISISPCRLKVSRTGGKVNGNVVMTTTAKLLRHTSPLQMVSSLHFALSLAGQRKERAFGNERHWLSITYCPVHKVRLGERAGSLRRVTDFFMSVVTEEKWRRKERNKCHDDYRERSSELDAVTQWTNARYSLWLSMFVEMQWWLWRVQQATELLSIPPFFYGLRERRNKHELGIGNVIVIRE